MHGDSVNTYNLRKQVEPYADSAAVPVLAGGIRAIIDRLKRVEERATRYAREIGQLRAALRFYADDDARSVEMGILERVDKRPATAALADK